MDLLQKRQRFYHIWNNRVTLLLVVSLQHNFTFLFIFQNFLKVTTRSFTIDAMQFYSLQQRKTVDFGLLS